MALGQQARSRYSRYSRYSRWGSRRARRRNGGNDGPLATPGACFARPSGSSRRRFFPCPRRRPS